MSDTTSVVPLRIRFPYESEEDFIDRYGTNVARGGVFVATRSLKSEGTVLQFEFVLRGGDRLMRGEGVVVKTHVDHGGSRSGMTVRFTRLDPPSKALVERVVARRGKRDPAAVPPPRDPGQAGGEHIPRTFSLPEIPAVTAEGAPLGAEEPASGISRTFSLPEIPAATAEASPVGAEEPVTAEAHVTQTVQPRTITALPSSHSRVSFALDPAPPREVDEPEAADACVAVDSRGEVDSRDTSDARDTPSARDAGAARDAVDEPDTMNAGAEAGAPEGEDEAQTAADEAYARWVRASASAGARSERGDTPEQPVASGTSVETEEAEPTASHRDTRAAAQPAAALTRTAEAPPPADHDGASTDTDQRASDETPPPLDTGSHREAEATALANAEPVLGIDASGSTPSAALIADGKIHPVEAAAGRSRDDAFTAVHAAARARAGRRFEHTAICVPARYTDLDRAEVMRSAEAAGLPRCQLFNASTAVALAFAHGRGLPRKRVLVCDVGAGDAEIALVAITGDDVEVVVTAGVAALPEHPLSPEATHPVVALCTSLLEDAHLTARSLDEVLLVGPGAQTPHLAEKLEAALQRRPAEGVDVLGAVAAGAALLAQGLHRSARGRAAPRVNETLGVPLGLVTRGGATQRVLERGTPLPAQKTLGFPLEAGERLALVVVQGSASEMADNAVLGAFEVTGERAGEALLHVGVGADGRVDLTAQPPGSRSLIPLVRGTSLDRETLLPLLALAPQPADREPDPRPGRLWGSIRRLLGGR